MGGGWAPPNTWGRPGAAAQTRELPRPRAESVPLSLETRLRSDGPDPSRSPKGPQAPCVRARDALEGTGPRRRLHKRWDRRLEEVAKAVGGGYCRLQMPLRLALGVRGTVAGHRLGALEGGGGVPPPLSDACLGRALPTALPGPVVSPAPLGKGGHASKPDRQLHNRRLHRLRWSPAAGPGQRYD